MPDSPEEITHGTDQPFDGSLPESLVEDKEKAVDMAYAGKATREVAKRMEKVNPQVAAELQAKADQLEQNAGEQYDAETDFVNNKIHEAASMIANFESGLDDKGYVRLEKSVSPGALERIRHQFFGLFEGGVEARKSTDPESDGTLTHYNIDLPEGYTISETVDVREGVTFFQIHKTLEKHKLGIDG